MKLLDLISGRKPDPVELRVIKHLSADLRPRWISQWTAALAAHRKRRRRECRKVRPAPGVSMGGRGPGTLIEGPQPPTDCPALKPAVLQHALEQPTWLRRQAD